MKKECSKKYRKALVCVRIGLKQEKEIEDDLYIFYSNQKQQLKRTAVDFFREYGKCFILKVSKTDYQHSPRVYINNENELDKFINFGVDELFDQYQEAWFVKRAATVQWKCRVIISSDVSVPEIIEMIYCDNDHGLDKYSRHENKYPYVRYQRIFNKSPFKCVAEQNSDDIIINVTDKIAREVLKFENVFNNVRQDLEFMGLQFISIDFRVLEDGRLNFHDWDAPDFEKVLNYYVSK